MTPFYGQACNLPIILRIVSLVLVSRYVTPFASHSGICSGFFIVCDSVWVSTFCVDVKIFSQKLGSLSSPGDFHLCNFFSGNSTSFNLMSSHSCWSVSFVLSSSLRIHSASSLRSFSLLQVFFQNFSTSFVGGDSLISMICFPISR